MKLIVSGATIKLSNLDEIGKHFDTAIQQIHELEKSRDSWKKKYMDLKNTASVHNANNKGDKDGKE